MDSDRMQGAVRNVIGQGETAVGDLTGNAQGQASGIADQAIGTAQNAYGRAKDIARDALDRAPDAWSEAVGSGQKYARQGAVAVRDNFNEQPLAGLLLAGAVGYLIGWAIHARR